MVKVIFRAEEDFDRMIRLIHKFLIPHRKGFDWSSIYSREYSDLGRSLSGVKDKDKIKQISHDFFMKVFDENKKHLIDITKNFQKEWDKDGDELLDTLSSIVEHKLPKKTVIRAIVSLNPICPRFLKDRAFDVYWRKTTDSMNATALHEILHFMWFDKWKEVFPDYNEKEFESPHLIWKLSEMVPKAILNDEKMQKIFKHEHEVYAEWGDIKIDGKPLLDHIQKIYDSRTSFSDFMKKAYAFVRKHEKKL